MGSAMEDLSRRPPLAGEQPSLLVRGCVLRRAKITSSLSADINLFGREIRDQVDLAYFVRFGGFCLLSLSFRPHVHVDVRARPPSWL